MSKRTVTMKTLIDENAQLKMRVHQLEAASVTHLPGEEDKPALPTWLLWIIGGLIAVLCLAGMIGIIIVGTGGVK